MFFEEDKKIGKKSTANSCQYCSLSGKVGFPLLLVPSRVTSPPPLIPELQGFIKKVNKKYKYFSVFFELPSLTACISHQSNPTVHLQCPNMLFLEVQQYQLEGSSSSFWTILFIKKTKHVQLQMLASLDHFTYICMVTKVQKEDISSQEAGHRQS